MTLQEIQESALQIVAENAGKRLTIEEIARQVGCRAATLYTHLQDANFRELFMAAYRNALAADVPEIVGKFVELAKGGSFKHGKLILAISGFYQEKTVVQGEVSVRTGDIPFQSDEDRRAFAQETLVKLLGGAAHGDG